jgi:hypothetical protein
MILQEIKINERAFIAARCAESRRTQEWVETSLDYKKDHYKCEYCGEVSDILESHDILPYRCLTEVQRHDRDFLKRNLILLCHEHHHIVAHLGDPDWLKFDPRIREICERKTEEEMKCWWEENKEKLERLQKEKECYAKRMDDLRSYVKKLPGNKVIVEKMMPDNTPRL